MQLILYNNFSKRRNSTKQPTGGTTYDVKLKAGCSVEQPVFLIDGIALSVNYAQWNGAYYFVDDIILGNNNIYELHCSIDVLATYKSAIGASTQFVERSSNTYDSMVPDHMLSASQEIRATHTNETIASRWTTPGIYVIRTFSRRGVRYYAYTSLDDIQGILNNTEYGISDNNLAALVQTIGNNLFDVSAYVSNVMWLPISLSDISHETQQVAVGFWVLSNFTAERVTSKQVTKSGTLNMPANDYSDFRKCDDRYSRYNIYLPGVGVINMPAIYADKEIQYISCFDISTGNVTYKLYSVAAQNTQGLIGSFSGQLGVEIPYSTSRIDVGSIAQTLLSPPGGALGSVMGGGMAGAIMSGVGWAVNTAFDVTKATLEPMTSINSICGNMSNIINNPGIRVSVTNFETKEYLTPEAGRPLFEHRQISSIPGFIKCSMPSLDSIAIGSEKDAINNYMSAGFFYE